MEFCVLLFAGANDGGEVCVDVNVTEVERCLLTECYNDDIELTECEGLEELVQRITEEAVEEGESLSEESVEYTVGTIYFPEEIIEAEGD